MIATVGSLLDGAHARAWELCSAAEGMREDRAAALLAAWPRLASATLRALDAVPLEPVWLDDTAAVRQVLVEVIAASHGWQTVDVQPQGDVPAPNRDIVAIARRIGLIADLLSGHPAASTDVDRAAVVGLQANLLAPVHAVAVAQVQNVELVAGFPSHAVGSSGLGRHVRSSWVRALDRAGLSLIGRHRVGPSCAVRQSGHQQPCR